MQTPWGGKGSLPQALCSRTGLTSKLWAPAQTPPPAGPPSARAALRPRKHHTGGLSPKYLCEHQQPDQIGEDGDQQDEGLPAVLLAEDGGVHVHKGCDEALHADKLQKAEIPPLSAHPDRLPSPTAPPSAKFKPVPKGWWLSSGRQSPCTCTFTWLSSPSKTTIRKKKHAQSGEKGSMTTARG